MVGLSGTCVNGSVRMDTVPVNRRLQGSNPIVGKVMFMLDP